MAEIKPTEPTELQPIQFRLQCNFRSSQVNLNGKPLSPRKSQKVYNHSPDGFSWGYAGSGPAQLALAILLELGLTQTQALAYYQRFKMDVIATLGQRDINEELVFDPKKYDAQDLALRGQMTDSAKNGYSAPQNLANRKH